VRLFLISGSSGTAPELFYSTKAHSLWDLSSARTSVSWLVKRAIANRQRSAGAHPGRSVHSRAVCQVGPVLTTRIIFSSSSMSSVRLFLISGSSGTAPELFAIANRQRSAGAHPGRSVHSRAVCQVGVVRADDKSHYGTYRQPGRPQLDKRLGSERFSLGEPRQTFADWCTGRTGNEEESHR
jgi:hypothetical protein